MRLFITFEVSHRDVGGTEEPLYRQVHWHTQETGNGHGLLAARAAANSIGLKNDHLYCTVGVFNTKQRDSAHQGGVAFYWTPSMDVDDARAADWGWPWSAEHAEGFYPQAEEEGRV